MRNKAFSKKVLCLVVIGSLMSPTLAFGQSSTLIVTQPINNSAALTKDETVFATLDSTGAPKSTSVTSWIHSDNMLPELKDKSNLTNIKNLKGSETPTKNGDSLVWKTDKNDIFYSGDSNKTLPIGVKITYYFNDKEIAAKDLAGKTGKVKIKVDFDNKTKKMVNINGKARTVCEAIPITTVINMPTGNFSKIVATDGTIMKVGNNNVLTFISVPGFQESLGLKNGDLGVTLANSVVVTADAKDFKLSPIYFAASPDLLDLDNIAGGPNTMSALSSKVNEAKAGISKLADGTSKLAGGAKALNDGVQLLAPGAAQVAGGVKLVDDGVKQLAPGAAQVAGGAKLVDDGLQQLALGAKKLNDNYTGDYTKIITQLNQLIQGYKAPLSVIPSVTPQGQPANLYVLLDMISKGLLAQTKNTTDPTKPTLYDAIALINGGSAKLAANTPTLSAGAQKVSGGVATLAAKTPELLAGAQKVSGGVATLAAKTPELSAGTQELNAGVTGLTGKITPLTAKLDDVLAAKNEMVKIAKENSSFSGVDSSMKGSLKFVMQTGDIKVVDSGAKKELKTEKKSFWDKVYDAFIK